MKNVNTLWIFNRFTTNNGKTKWGETTIKEEISRRQTLAVGDKFRFLKLKRTGKYETETIFWRLEEKVLEQNLQLHLTIAIVKLWGVVSNLVPMNSCERWMKEVLEQIPIKYLKKRRYGGGNMTYVEIPDRERYYNWTSLHFSRILRYIAGAP